MEPDLLVLDDLFLARRISEHAAEVLQVIVHPRYKLRRSVVATSNRVVQDWGRYLGDATMATTILDRLMHSCAMLEFEANSYRLKEAAARIAINPEPSKSGRLAWGNLKWPSGRDASTRGGGCPELHGVTLRTARVRGFKGLSHDHGTQAGNAAENCDDP